MKKLISLLAVLAALSVGASLFAQEETGNAYRESEYYYFTFPIEKIYAHRLGYVVLYRNGSNRLVRTHIPEGWFVDIGSKGEVVMLRSGKEWPSMTVYYNKGEFSHVRLKLRQERVHETWGAVPLNVNIDDYFQNVEEVSLEFY